MKVTTHEEYFIRCLAQLARANGKLTIGEIATAEGLSLENAAKILARLRSLGFVTSLRGKEGGYLLARPAKEISVAQIIVGVAGGVFEFERCGSQRGEDGVLTGECVHHTDCGLRPVWLHLGELIHDFLSSITLADLAMTSEHRVSERLTTVALQLAQQRALRATRRLPAAPH